MPFFGRAFNIFRKPQSSEETPQDSVQDPPESSSKANKGFYPSAGPSEAPPAYEQACLPSQKTSTADPLRALAKYDTIFLVDDSGSMTTLIDNRRDPYYTRWEQAKETCIEFASLASKYDSDGIDIHFLNHVGSKRPGRSLAGYTGLKSRAQISDLFDSFEPAGETWIGHRLSQIAAPYVDLLRKWRAGNPKPKPRNYIVITDGRAYDEAALTSFIETVAREIASRELPNGQIGFQFVQVGDSIKATEFLQTLDDLDMERDIVDTVKCGDVDPSQRNALVSKILLGGVNRFHDQVML